MALSAWRRVKTAAIRGARSVNSFHVVMALTLQLDAKPTVPHDGICR
jgi:hypothetical protein